MAKFLTLLAAFLALLVTSVAALPQEHLAPSMKHDQASNILEKRQTIQNQVEDAGRKGMPIHERQVHNADYGSDSGPSGNPQTAQETSQPASTATPAAADSDSSFAAADAKKHRDFEPYPTDIDYTA